MHRSLASATFVAALCTIAAIPLRAQDSVMVQEPANAGATYSSGPGTFAVTTYLGVQMHDRSSALRRSNVIGALDVIYQVGGWLGVGVTGSVSQPRTDETYFPLVEMHGGDSVFFYRVHQRVAQYTLGLQGVLSRPTGRLQPYLLAGAGAYVFSMNPQATGRVERYSGPMLSLGAGLTLQTGTRAALTIDVRDVVFASFERARLDATDPLFRTRAFDPVAAGKPAATSTAHNPVLAIGVRFVPDSKGVPR